MGGVFFFWGWQNFATWWIFFLESEKKRGNFVMQQSIRQFSKIWLLKNMKVKKFKHHSFFLEFGT
jgi:hypothetical protein